MRTFALGVCFALVGLAARAGEVLKEPPANPDPQAYYMFYMHGLDIELGKNETQYEDILADLARRGFIVIGERRGRVENKSYVGKIGGQLRTLITAGVPPNHITVAGHSKGGMIALITSANVRVPGINYVAFASCARAGAMAGGRTTLSRTFPDVEKMMGRLLSAYEPNDLIATSCRPEIHATSKLVFEERMFETGAGHELFRTPKAVWVDVLEAWARGG